MFLCKYMEQRGSAETLKFKKNLFFKEVLIFFEKNQNAWIKVNLLK